MPDSWTLLRLRVIFTLILIVFSVSIVLLSGSVDADFETSSTPSNSTTKDFYWTNIKPSHELVWHPCYKPLRRECARLLVPLNHLTHSSENPHHAAIALIRVPSRFSSSTSAKSHPHYRGPILFNPGGPGGSGVALVYGIGDLLAKIVGDEFDVVGFDPRGVARSTPKVTFFDGVSRGERETFGLEMLDIIRGGPNDKDLGVEGAKGKSVEETWARALVRNGLARENAGEWLGNVNTEQTAYDMLSITKAFGREKLMYWGFSYGTVLGSTFAALFPDKVERVVLDGVVDAENYYATLWTNNLLDTPKTLNQFFTTCHAAGASSCPFWAPSPSLIAANLTRIYKNIITNPIPIRTPTSYGVLDYSRVRRAVFLALYSPWAAWPILSQALAHLGGPERDPELMWRITEMPTFRCPCSCNGKDQQESDLEVALPDAQTAILCSDGLNTPSDLASAKDYFENLSSKSEWADIWAKIRLSCAQWPKAKKGFQGPVKGKTASPILLIGNTADPVTPLANAKAMSKRFPGSRVLTQDSPGHCSINGPSVCTLEYVREYFLSGKLPPEGMICPVTMPPFPDLPLNVLGSENVRAGGERNDVVFSLKGEDKGVDGKMWDVAYELSNAWKPFNRAFL